MEFYRWRQETQRKTPVTRNANSQDKTPFSYDNTTVRQGEGEVHH